MGSSITGIDIRYVAGLQTALDLKAPSASPIFYGTTSGTTKYMIGLGNVDNTADLDKPISTATAISLGVSQSNKANIIDPTFTGTVTDITKSVVGLGSVDNTSDANKPVSTATQTSLDAKADKTNTYTKGDVDLHISNLIASAPNP